MLYEEIGYYPRPEWLNVGTHFVFEKGIVMWDSNTWRMITRTDQHFEEKLHKQQYPYAPIYKNMLRAIHGETYGPSASEYAVDVAIAQGAYRSSLENREIDVNYDPG